MIWNWEFAVAILPIILEGLVVTLQAVALGMTMALAVGLFWAILRRSSRKWVRWPANLFVEFVRSTPLLVQIFYIFFVFPRLGLTLSPLTAGVLALGIHYSCYTAEVYRAGINAVSRGQWEAARALNLSRFATYRHVVLPQAIPPIIPALGNYLIAMFKDAPLLSVITVLGILQRTKNIGNETGSYLEPMTIVGVVFLILSLLAGLAVGWLDRRLKLKTS